MVKRLLLLTLLCWPEWAMAQTLVGDRVKASERIVIGSSTFGTTSPLQIVGLPGALTIAGVVIYDSSGNLGTSTDYPRKSTAQTITGGWTFNTLATAIAGATLTGTIDLQGTLSDSTGNLSLGDAVDLDGRLNLRNPSDTTKALAISVNSSGDVTFTLNTASRTYLIDKNVTLTADLSINGGDLGSSTTLRIMPDNDLVLVPPQDMQVTPGWATLVNTGDNIVRPTNNYEENLGSLTKKWLTLHAAELWVETLVAQNTIATIGGRILVGPTTTLTMDAAAGDGYVCVKHNEMVSGDRAYLEANGFVEFLAITSGATMDDASCNATVTDYLYTVTRNLDGSGANAWAAGDALFNTGTTNDGWIDLYSVASIRGGTELGPTIVGNFRTSTTYNAWTPRWAIGRLDGLYGYTSTSCGTGTTYPCVGAAFGDPAEANIVIDAWNGIRIRDGTSNKLTMDTSGNLSLVGDIVVGTSGVIRSGATAYLTGSGYVLDYASSAGRFYVGNCDGACDGGGTEKWLSYSAGTLTIEGGTIAASALYTRANGDLTVGQDGDIIMGGTQPSISNNTVASDLRITTSDDLILHGGDTISFQITSGPLNAMYLQTGGNDNTELAIYGRNSQSGSDAPSSVVVHRSFSDVGSTGVLPGMFTLVQADGGYSFFWVDDSADLRTANAHPEADGTPALTSGTRVGEQHSALAMKNLLRERFDPDASLALVLDTRVFDFTYKHRKDGEVLTGIVTDYAPWFGTDNNKALNTVNATGHLVQAIKAQQAHIDTLEARLKSLEETPR